MTAYLFIDGGFLERLIEKSAREYGVSLSSSQLNFQNIVGGFQKTFYYDALPVRKQNEAEADFNAKHAAKQKLFDHINRTPYVHVRASPEVVRPRNASKRV